MTDETLTQASLLTTKIRQEIVESTLPPGHKLKVRELAERYQVGASPIREALSRLLTTSLVVTEDRRGFRVAPVTKAELDRLIWTRIGTEAMALCEAIKNGDKQWEGQLIAAHHMLMCAPRPTDTQSENYRSWECAHHAFHTKLLEPCNSPWLLDLIDSLYHHASRYRWIAMRSAEHGGGRTASTEHTDILSACLERDAERAVQLLTKHYQKTSELSKTVLEEQSNENKSDI